MMKMFLFAPMLMTTVCALGDPSKSIVENAVNTPELATLVKVLSAPGYGDILKLLSDPGTFTVFAPNNQAFAKANLNVSEVEAISAVLTYHVLGSVVKSTDLDVLQFPETLSTNPKYVNMGAGKGQVLDLYVTPNNKVMIYFRDKFATVTVADVECSNGVVHIIDEVVMLPLETSRTAQYTGLTTLLAVAAKAGLAGILDNTAGVTIFAPNNIAFDDFPGGLDDLTPEQLKNILSYHVIPNSLYTPDCKNESLPTLQGAELYMQVRTPGSGPQVQVITVDGAKVVAPNVMTKNGVVHVIDTVLVPP